MGGIVGKLSFDRRVQISPATVRRMLDAVAHRCAADPANQGATYLGHGIALGSFDRTPADEPHVGHNESGTIRAVADADLTNAASLRKVLEDRGHRIAGPTHAELIAHAYEEWGDACVERLAGPFACAIWDDLRRRLLLARDHFGIRPLSFALLHGDGVVFASDVKALLQDPSVGRTWHPEAVDTYLALGYVPAPITIHPRISKVEPAHTLVVEGRRLTTRQYWDLSARPSWTASEREVVNLLESCLRASVESLAAEADTCVLMSGGTASTAIAAVSPHDSTSVAVGVDKDWSDLDRVSSISAHLRLHSEIDVASIDAAELIALLASQFDEPMADPAAVSQYAVYVAARRYAQVALTGHGAKAFWGGSGPRPLFHDGQRHSLYTRRFSWQVRDAHPLEQYGGDPRPWLADHHLAIADRAATAAGLRLHHPYLDRNLVDLACMLPDDLKNRRPAMHAVRQVALRHLPAVLLDAPVRPARQLAWLSSALASLVPEVLLAERFDTRGIFSRPAIRTLWDEHRMGRRDHARQLWSLLMLEFWFRELIDGDAAARPLEYAVLVRAA